MTDIELARQLAKASNCDTHPEERLQLRPLLERMADRLEKLERACTSYHYDMITINNMTYEEDDPESMLGNIRGFTSCADERNQELLKEK